ncbi:MAG: hypothetical protein M1826_002575 [Phylliscum demangeonii]|nr:MAG: hypothetical protein M1826_002575 [Phylliscum demangeonii]
MAELGMGTARATVMPQERTIERRQTMLAPQGLADASKTGPSARGATAVGRVGTCIWHFRSSMRFSASDVSAPDAALATSRPLKGSGAEG